MKVLGDLAVWKYEFAVGDEVTIEMRAGARILAVGCQRPRHICIWALVEPIAPSVRRRLAVRGTGQPIPAEQLGNYIGTVFDQNFVWHVFEAKP